VLQCENVHGQYVLLFSCLGTELSAGRKALEERGGIWAVNAPGPLGPFDISSAYRIADEALYVGRLVQDRDGAWNLLAFENADESGNFVGRITDPLKVRWENNRLTVEGLLTDTAGERTNVSVAG
jgi:beta-fructofuranosidase